MASPHDAEQLVIDMYEAGGDEGSGFHVFNLAPDHYHRAEVLQRSGAIDIGCQLDFVTHGILSEEADRYATLMVMQWHFQPKKARRISEITIELLFEGSPDSHIEVERISFPGAYTLMPTTQKESVTKGVGLDTGAGSFVPLNWGGKWEKTVSTETSDGITLLGARRVVNNKPPNRIATWTLYENESQPRGIPAALKVAVLVSRDDREAFSCKVDCTCKTDMRTAAQSLLRKMPRDDPVIFQPDPSKKGTRPNRTVTYGDESLEGVDLSTHSDVTVNTLIADGRKT